jgi:hypothetical protein
VEIWQRDCVGLRTTYDGDHLNLLTLFFAQDPYVAGLAALHEDQSLFNAGMITQRCAS